MARLSDLYAVGDRVMFRCESKGNFLETGTVAECFPNGGLGIDKDHPDTWYRSHEKQRVYVHDFWRVKPWDGVEPASWGGDFWPTRRDGTVTARPALADTVIYREGGNCREYAAIIVYVYEGDDQERVNLTYFHHNGEVGSRNRVPHVEAETVEESWHWQPARSVK